MIFWDLFSFSQDSFMNHTLHELQEKQERNNHWSVLRSFAKGLTVLSGFNGKSLLNQRGLQGLR